MRLKKFATAFLLLCPLLNGCQTSVQTLEEPKPVVQEVIVEKPCVCPTVPQELTLAQKAKKLYSLGIIGEVEPVRFPPMKGSLLARIDTGAAKSSLYAHNIVEFEREGKKWVSFDIINPQTNETHHFEKRIHKQTTIRRQSENEDRLVVLMMLHIGKEKLNVAFSLADRSKFDYPVLIGRNIIKGRAIVDTSISQTLY